MAVLAADWARAEGGSVLALIVDHGLRAGSAAEAAEAAGTLGGLGIPARVLTLTDLAAGVGLPARARAARFAALERACEDAGILDLLLAHHAADQAETVLMRQLRGSGPDGLAGMAAVSETSAIRLLRPLLGMAPGRLRATLAARGLAWAEDPTNADSRFTRARLRAARGDRAGAGPATRALAAAAAADARRRAAAEAAAATWLAKAVMIRPEGFACLPGGAWPPAALSALVRMITGADHPPPPEAIAAIAAAPAEVIGGGICLAGARLRPAGRLGPGFLIAREAAAMAGPVAAVAGATWDGRFRRPHGLPDLPGETIGALGAEARRLRNMTDLPAMVLETLPAYRSAQARLIAIPALNWPDRETVSARKLLFHPRRPAGGAAFSAIGRPHAMVEQADDLGEIGSARRSCHDGSVRRT
jgi:tRNA(Ile)-lysidine synthase